MAPGERIASCATGRLLDEARAVLDAGWQPPPDTAYSVDHSGTSMAAPHVSGAIAAFLTVHREFIGRAEEVKRIFLDTATSLGREPCSFLAAPLRRGPYGRETASAPRAQGDQFAARGPREAIDGSPDGIVKVSRPVRRMAR